MIDGVSQSSASGNPGIVMLGVPFDHVTVAEAIARIENMIASGRPHYVVTPNLDFLAQARRDVELRRILMEAHLVLCDGTPLVWASRLLGNGLPQRVAGSDIVPILIELAAEKNYRVFFLGATSEAGRQALEKLRARHANLAVEHYSPPFRKLLDMDHEEIRRRIQGFRPHLLFVCFGCPKQEKWIAMHYRELGVPVTAGVGGTLDFVAGRLRRAPVWMQRTGTEWIYRLAQEPRRLLYRYSKDIWVFGAHVLGQGWKLQLANRLSKSGRAAGQLPTTWQGIQLPQRLDCLAARQKVVPSQLPAGAQPCVVDASELRFIDSAGVGLLIGWHKQTRSEGRPLIILAPSGALKRCLALMRLDGFFRLAPDVPTAEALIAAASGKERACVTFRHTAGVGCLAWHGEIRATEAQAVWNLTESCLEDARGTQGLKLDLSDVPFIDSAGLNLLVRVKKTASRMGLELKLTGLQPPVLNVLRLADMTESLLGRTKAQVDLPVITPLAVQHQLRPS